MISCNATPMYSCHSLIHTENARAEESKEQIFQKHTSKLYISMSHVHFPTNYQNILADRNKNMLFCILFMYISYCSLCCLLKRIIHNFKIKIKLVRTKNNYIDSSDNILKTFFATSKLYY